MLCKAIVLPLVESENPDMNSGSDSATFDQKGKHDFCDEEANPYLYIFLILSRSRLLSRSFMESLLSNDFLP
jgi:hypothetical protein